MSEPNRYIPRKTTRGSSAVMDGLIFSSIDMIFSATKIALIALITIKYLKLFPKSAIFEVANRKFYKI